MSIITTDLVAIDVDAGGDKEAVIGLLAARLADAGRSSDGAGLVAAAMAREAQSATGLARRHRDPALPLAVRRPSRPSVSPGCRPPSTSAPPTARPTSPS